MVDATLSQNSAGVPKSYEKQAVKQIQAGATEVGTVSLAGEIRYVQTINATESCVACHSKSGTIAMVSVRGSLE